MKIRTWDKVIVMSGKEKDRGQEAEVLKVFTGLTRPKITCFFIKSCSISCSGKELD